jgi:nucleotide-binding universal stress UspA family protein
MVSTFAPHRVLAVQELSLDQAVIERAASIARTFGASLVILLGTAPTPPELPPADVTLIGEPVPEIAPEAGVQALEESYREQDDAIRARLHALGVSADVVRGDTDAESIATIAREHESDLVVLGAEQRGFLDRLFTEDTAAALAHRRISDVLVVAATPERPG